MVFLYRLEKASGRVHALALLCAARSALHLLAEEARHGLRKLALRLAGGAVAVRGHEQHAAEHVPLGEDGRGDGDGIALVGVDDRQRAAVGCVLAACAHDFFKLTADASVKQLAQSISETENSLCSLLAQTPHKIERGSLESQRMPADLLIGVPVQLLSRRPDVRRAEYSLMSAYYATAEARSALYPQITLSGTAGWTNSAGSQIVNPGKLLLSAAGQLLQPIFQAGANRARVKIAKAQQQEAMLAYEQTILNAGQEVNDALTACQTARESAALYDQQVASLRRAVESTELLMQQGSTTYLEVLTARQSLLSAQLQQVANRFTELQSVVTLYHALGGGRETETAQ